MWWLTKSSLCHSCIPAKRCWSNIADGGPTSNQHQLNASCLLSSMTADLCGKPILVWCWNSFTNISSMSCLMFSMNPDTCGKPMLVWCWYTVCDAGLTLKQQHQLHACVCCDYPGSARHWPTGDLMLAHRLRRWSSIKPALGQHWVAV